MGPHPAQRALARLAPVLLALLASAAAAQNGEEQTYCNITGVTVEQFSNVVRVALRADGLLRPQGDWHNYEEEVAPGDWRLKRVTRFGFRLRNARSKVGSFVNVGKYPISHLELTVPPEAQQGVGLDVVAVTYRPGELHRAQMPGWGFWNDLHGDRIQVDMLLDQDQRGMTFLGLSDRSPLAAEPETLVAAAPEETKLSVVAGGGGLRLNCLNAPRQRIFQELAGAAGAQIIVADDVQGYGSACLPPLPLERALQVLCDAWALSLSRRATGFEVRGGMAQTAAGHELAEQQRVLVHNLPAAEARDALPDFLERYVHIDSDRNALVVAAPPALVAKLRRDVERLDQPPPSVQLEALLIETKRNLDWGRDLGLDLEDRHFRSVAGSLSGDLVFGVAARRVNGFGVRLQDLVDRGVVAARSAPRVTALNGQQAEVFVGKRQFYIALVGWRQEPALRYTDVGVRLTATPWTGDGQQITVPVRVESNTIVGADKTGAPLLSVYRARCELRVSSGDSVFVGGLRLSDESVARRRLPVLGELPLLGSLFTSRARASQQSEAALFLTPRAVMPQSRGPGVSPASVGRAFLPDAVGQAFLPDAVDQAFLPNRNACGGPHS